MRSQEFRDAVGVNIRTQRIKNSYSQEAICARLERQGMLMSRTQLLKVERGERDITWREVLGVCDVTDIHPARLLQGTEFEAISTTTEDALLSLIETFKGRGAVFAQYLTLIADALHDTHGDILKRVGEHLRGEHGLSEEDIVALMDKALDKNNDKV